MKVLLFTVHRAPYRDYYLQELSRKPNVELIHYVAEKNTARHSEWEYESPITNVKYLGKDIFPTISPIKYRKGTISALKKEKYDICVTPYWIMGLFPSLLKKGKPVVLTADTSYKTTNNPFLNRFKRFVFGRFDAIYCPGRASGDFFESYGVTKNKIFYGYYTDDAKRIFHSIESVDRTNFRKELNIKSDEFVFLFIGKLLHKRKIGSLLEIAKRVQNRKIRFIIIGDGEEDSLVLKYIKKFNNVIYIPRVRLNEVEMYYAVSDAYIHPGHEQYSLTTYEAAIAGIPIIATSGVGCVKDCLYDGVNGFVVQEDNLKQLYDSVIKLYEHKYDVYKCQMISRNIVNNKGVVWASNNLLSAIKFAMNNH